MKVRGFAALIAAVLVLSGLSMGPVQAAGKKAKKTKGPQVVGTDETGDWGCSIDCVIAPAGDALGQDVTKASIGMDDKKTVNFVIGLNSLPPSGGVPEFSRYNWEIVVDGSAIQISGGFTEYIRGVCNPLYNPLICPPPRDPGEAPFFLRTGGCTVGGACEEVGLVHGRFDVSSATITIPVPLEMIDAKPGSKIAPGVSTLTGGTIYAAPQAAVTAAQGPFDALTVTKTFVVPKK